MSTAAENKDGLTEVAKGVFKKSETIYFVECSVSGKLCFCSKERLDKLTAKAGSLEKVSPNYICREAKQKIRAEQKAALKAPKAEKPPKAPKAKKEKAPKAPKANPPAGDVVVDKVPADATAPASAPATAPATV